MNNPVFAALIGLAVLAGFFVPGVAAQGLAPTPAATSSNVTGPEMVELFRQFILAGNRGDVNATLAFLTEDAFVVRGARCSAAVPCVGHAAIRVLLESEARNRNSLGFLGTPAVSGETVSGRLEWWAVPIGATGTQRLHLTFTATFRGDKIARLVQQLDPSDATTANFVNILRTANATDVRLEALNRGDVATAVAGFTADGLFEGLRPCSPSPCIGPEAIRAAFEELAADRIRITVIGGRSTSVGDQRTSRLEIRAESIRAAGVERVLATLTAIVPGNQLSSVRIALDGEDPQTATFLAQQVTPQLPAQLPRAGEGPVAAGLGVVGVLALLLPELVNRRLNSPPCG